MTANRAPSRAHGARRRRKLGQCLRRALLRRPVAQPYVAEPARVPAPPRQTLSERWWDLDWRHHAPWSFDGIWAEAATFEEVMPFMAEHYPTIFADGGDRFLDSPFTEKKKRFCEELDWFVFRDGERVAGICAGHPTDWSTYYLRTAALLPEYRGRGLVPRLYEKFWAPLARLGIERVEGDVSPGNTPMLHMLMGLGFLVNAAVNSERWGAMLHVTKFLSPKAESVFMRQFCCVPTCGRNPHSVDPRRP